MSDTPTEDEAPRPRPKRVLSQAQKDALAAGRAAARQRRATEDGAELVRTSSAEVRALQSEEEEEELPPESQPRSLDELARRRFGEGAASAPPEPDPDIERVARETKIYTPSRDVLPPPEEEPLLSDGVTEEALPELRDPNKPQSLADLLSMPPIFGDGQYYIEVTRRSPSTFGGAVCKGLQPPITAYISTADFVNIYGGGEYQLVLYGPPKHGGKIDPATGRLLPKRLSDPVKIEFSPTTYPPNLQFFPDDDEDVSSGEEESTMRQYPTPMATGQLPRRPQTTADARVLEVQVNAEERREQREEERLRRREDEIRESERRVTKEVTPLIEVVRESQNATVGAVERLAAVREEASRREIEALRESLRKSEESNKELARRFEAFQERDRGKPTDVGEIMTGMSNMMSSMNNGPASAAATQALTQARDQVQQLTQSHAAELQRLGQKHQDEISRITMEYRTEQTRINDSNKNEIDRIGRANKDELARQEERFKETLRSTEARAQEAERRAQERVTESEARNERRLNELREEHRREIDNLRTQHTQRIEDERRQHERDLKMHQSTHESRIATEKSMHENQISVKSGEITRLKEDVERWRREAEDNKDFSKHVEKAQATAEALGWEPPGSGGGGDDKPAPKDWKEVVARVGSEVAGKIPDIVQTAGETLQRLRSGPGAVQPADVQAHHYNQMMAAAQQTMPRQMAMGSTLHRRDGSAFVPTPLRFGTEDGDFTDPSVPAPRPMPEPSFGPPMQFAAPPPPVSAPPPMQSMVPVQQPMYPQQLHPQAQMPVPQQQAFPQQSMVPAQQQAAAPPQQQPQAAAQQGAPQAPQGASVVVSGETIVSAASQLEQAFTAGVPAALVAEQIVPDLAKQIGKENAIMLVQSLTPERVVQELQNAGRGGSPLVRRGGQKFLRELADESMKVLAKL